MDTRAMHWGIVGGGMLGLTLALRLSARGHQVTVIEAAPCLGGLASAWRLGDITWDRHYHVTLLSDTHTRGLLAELGLERDMQWVQTRTGFYTGGRLHSMSSAVEFLRFPPLGPVDKARLALTILYASRVRDWRRLERIPVADWLRRLSGERTFQRIWLPLLRSKLGENYTRTSAAFIWATIQRMYAARRSGLKKEMFGYVPGGYARILDRLAERLRERGVGIVTGSPTQRVTRAGSRLRVTTAGGASQIFDRVAVTVPAPLAARLCPEMDEGERARLEAIEYQGIVCASVLLKAPLASYYVTNITESWVPFTAVIEMSALVDRAEFGGRSLVYLPRYAAGNDAVFEVTDEALRERFLAALERMYPHFHRDQVECFQVSRVRHVHALSTLGYSERLPPMRLSVPGLFIVNSSHIVNGTLNVNETVGLADRALEAIAHDNRG